MRVVAAEHVEPERPLLHGVDDQVDRPADVDAVEPDGELQELLGGQARSHARHSARAKPRETSGNVEGVLARRLLPLDVDGVDARARRAPAAPVDHAPDAVRVALEDGLDRAVRAVPHPAAEAERARPVARLGAEEDALNPPADADARPGHSLKPSSPTSGTNRQGTDLTTAGPSGLLTISSRRWFARPPTGTTIRPPGFSCS